MHKVSVTGNDPIGTGVASFAKQLKLSIGLVLATSNTEKVKAVMTAEFGDASWDSSYQLINEESGFSPCKINGGAVDCHYNGNRACGLGQSLPCSKVLSRCGTLADVVCQAKWIAGYIRNRYDTPEKAWEFHLANNYY